MNNNKLVTIIILTYKNLEYLQETINSVIIQTYPNIELIIADDGTENFKSEVYEEYIKRNNAGNIKNIKIYSNSINLGIVKNVNKAIRFSKGEFTKLIGGDDIFYSSDIIEKMTNYMITKNIEVITTDILYCDSNMRELDNQNNIVTSNKSILKAGEEPEEFFKWLALSNRISAPGVMFKKSLFDEYGYFDEEYKLMEDWPMWLRLSRKGCKIHYMDILSVKYRFGVGISSTPNPIIIKDIIKCHEKDIFPYRKELGNKICKRIKWRFIKKYKYSNYSTLRKIILMLFYADIIFREYRIKKRNHK